MSLLLMPSTPSSSSFSSSSSSLYATASHVLHDPHIWRWRETEEGNAFFAVFEHITIQPSPTRSALILLSSICLQSYSLWFPQTSARCYQHTCTYRDTDREDRETKKKKEEEWGASHSLISSFSSSSHCVLLFDSALHLHLHPESLLSSTREEGEAKKRTQKDRQTHTAITLQSRRWFLLFDTRILPLFSSILTDPLAFLFSHPNYTQNLTHRDTSVSEHLLREKGATASLIWWEEKSKGSNEEEEGEGDVLWFSSKQEPAAVEAFDPLPLIHLCLNFLLLILLPEFSVSRNVNDFRFCTCLLLSYDQHI